MLGFDRITFDPNTMGGRACIRGMRVTVSLIVNLVANGMNTQEILDAYPYLEPGDVQQALQSVTEGQVRVRLLPLDKGTGISCTPLLHGPAAPCVPSQRRDIQGHPGGTDCPDTEELWCRAGSLCCCRRGIQLVALLPSTPRFARLRCSAMSV